jgi:hypothetical protein
MTDPIGILASAITFAGAAITVADTVTFLHNDVTDTRLILQNIKENASEDRSLDTRLALPDSGPYGSPENISRAEYLLRRIKRVLVEIDTNFRDVTKSRSLGRITIHHRAWILHRAKLKLMRQDLRELKTSVAVHFSASSKYVETCSNLASF